MATEQKNEQKPKELKVQQVSLKIIQTDTQGELSDVLHLECGFCGKQSALHITYSKLYEKLENEFYCAHCLRHQFFKRKSHILLLTFRAVIGYYYYVHYSNPLASHKIYYAQIQDYIEEHIAVGLRNPVFSYDPEAFMWFVDFTRIGKAKNKISYEDVLSTIRSMIDCFKIPIHLTNAKVPDFYNKFKDAINKFYTQRSRPFGKRIVVPTLVNCGAYENHTEDAKAFSALAFVRKDG